MYKLYFKKSKMNEHVNQEHFTPTLNTKASSIQFTNTNLATATPQFTPKSHITTITFYTHTLNTNRSTR